MLCKHLYRFLISLLPFVARCANVPGDKVVFTQARGHGISITGEIYMIELREGQSVILTAEPKTAGGHPAAYEKGSAVWTSSDPSIATVEPLPDNELQGRVKGVDGSQNGSVVIRLEADGDPDAEQTRPCIGTETATVTQGEAFTFGLSAGEVKDEEPIQDTNPTPQ